MHPHPEWPELGRDELDPPLRAPDSGWRRLPMRRLALGVGATSTPAVLLILGGIALGPHGADVLGRQVLAQVQAVVWVALAVMGVFVGLGLAAPAGVSERRLILPTALLAVITTVVIAGGLLLLVREAGIELAGNTVAAALMAGLCASVSAAIHTPHGATAELRRAARLADLDDVPLLIVGVVVLAWLTGAAAGWRLAATIGGGAAIGLAGCLLFERAREAERGLFVTGAVLLLAGVGAYLGTSPLLSGAIAAFVWVRTPGTADRITARDLRTLQHPFVALLLIFAGASVEWDVPLIWLAAFVLILRIAAKLLASVVAAPSADVPPALLASVLMHPGVMGIALALNTSLLLGAGYGWILSAVTVATAISELLAGLLPAGDEAPR